MNHDTGGAAAMAATVMSLFTGDDVNLHWAVDLGDRQLRDPSDREADPWWGAMLDRLIAALSNQPRRHDRDRAVMKVTVDIRAGYVNKRVTFGTSYWANVPHLMRASPPFGRWVLWPTVLATTEVPTHPWWYSDVPFAFLFGILCGTLGLGGWV